MNYKEKANWIKENNPFEKITGKLVQVEVVKHETATTGNAFFAVNEKGRKFKYSFYDDKKTAIRVDNNVRKCPHLLPKYHGMHKSIVLFDWIEGSILTHMFSENQVYKLGLLYGEIHKLKDTIGSSSSKRKAEKVLQKFEEVCKNNPGLIDLEIAEKAIKKFKDLIVHLNQDIILEMNDANPANIMENTNGKLTIVDEEALNHNIKGRGFIGYLKNFDIPQKKLFWKGYKKNHPNDYFTKDYESALHLFYLIKSFVHRFNKYGSDNSKTKKAYGHLKQLIK
jgi:hypothetical protein